MSNKNNRKVVYIDMDDTLCDFKGSVLRHIRDTDGIRWPQCQYKFFENLEPLEGAIDAVNKLKEKYTVFILTKPSVLNPLSYTEKRVWVEKYLGFEMCKFLILCPDKTIARGDYLIDDIVQDGNFIPEWEHIHFGTNDFPNWETVLKYLL